MRARAIQLLQGGMAMNRRLVLGYGVLGGAGLATVPVCGPIGVGMIVLAWLLYGLRRYLY